MHKVWSGVFLCMYIAISIQYLFFYSVQHFLWICSLVVLFGIGALWSKSSIWITGLFLITIPLSIPYTINAVSLVLFGSPVFAYVTDYLLTASLFERVVSAYHIITLIVLGRYAWSKPSPRGWLISSGVFLFAVGTSLLLPTQYNINFVRSEFLHIVFHSWYSMALASLAVAGVFFALNTGIVFLKEKINKQTRDK